MDKKYFPLTLGLLTSMALRYDHSFLAPFPDSMGMGEVTSPATSQNARIWLLQRLMLIYAQITGNSSETLDLDAGSLAQLTEEITGAGFYSLEHDAEYEASLKLTQHERIALLELLNLAI